MTALLKKRWHPNDSIYEVVELTPFILRAYIVLSRDGNKEFKDIVDDVCETIFSTNRVDQLLSTGIFYYLNNAKRVQDWFDEWLSDDGKVWSKSIGERNSIIQDFCAIKEGYNINTIDMNTVLEKARWSVVGYVSHKEYSGDYLLNWYNTLVEYDDKFIYEYAEIVKEISDKMELLGDNRFEYTLNSKIFSDIFSGGYQRIKEILQNNHYLEQGFQEPSYFVDGLIGYLKNANLTESELLSIWAIGMGLLDWRDEYNHATIHSLQRAIEICAEKNKIKSIYHRLKEYGAAYIDLSSDPMKYIIPNRWCDVTNVVSHNEASIDVVNKYLLSNKGSSKTSELKETIKEFIDRHEMPEDLFKELLRHEFEKESYSIRDNSFLGYLIRKATPDMSEQIICDYLHDALKKEMNYLELDLPALVQWKIYQQGKQYCKDGMDEIIKMHRSWMTAVGHFQEPKIEEEYNYYNLIDWEHADSIGTLFYQVMKILILSEDAEAARTALTGMFAMLRCDNRYLKNIERDWESFHYQAKEWLMMIYELLWNFDVNSRSALYGIVQKHCKDDDFNVALYSNILLESLWPDHFKKYLKENKDFFKTIPEYGTKKLIKTIRNSPWINGYHCVIEMKEEIERRLGMDLDDVERRTADYSEKLSEMPELIKLNRHSSCCRVVCDKVNIAFFRVLYKDWVSGRWNGIENELARVILSASEPYTLLITPSYWCENNGILIHNVDKFLELSRDKQLLQIREILEMNLPDEKVAVAGAVVDYTYKQEIIGVLLTYLNFPGMKPEYATYPRERNAKLILHDRDDFFKEIHYNITLFYNGIESFKQSNIMVGFSKEALLTLGWHISIDSGNVKLFDEYGKQIGELECYYGNRTSPGNRYYTNQPYMQRWIVDRTEVEKKLAQVRFLPPLKDVVDVKISEYK